MKKIVYQVNGYEEVYNPSAEQVEQKEILVTVETGYTEANLEIAKKKAYNGVYTIEDSGVEEAIEPTQLDIIEAQVAYTAMMTDTLLEV